MVIPFVWKEKWTDVQLFNDSLTADNGLDGWTWTWKEHDWKIGEKVIWVRSKW